MSQTIVIFGASGDLAKLKIYPALFELFSQNFLDESFSLIGYARSDLNLIDFQEVVDKSINKKVSDLGFEADKKTEFLNKVSYISGQYDSSDDFESLFEHIESLQKNIDESESQSQVLCYFSVPPQVFEPLILKLAEFNTRFNLKIVIEKPFGTSEESAKSLYSIINQRFSEHQFYLLDHYLGKISVRDILALRQQNSILNHLLKGKHIKSIQISALETLGVDNRLGYFDTVGSIRDMIQSHLLQVLALVAMDLPINNASVSREKGYILGSAQFHVNKGNLIIGQYEGYNNLDPNVKDSKTETFVAVKLGIDREDWFNTPIYIRTGKKLHKKESKVVIEFTNLTTQNPKAPTNKLTIEFAPNESISMELSHTFGEIKTTENIACAGPGCLGDYASLLNDALSGNHLHFVTFEQIIQSWRVIDQILDFKKDLKPLEYKAGENPSFANQIFGDTGSKWY